MEGVAAGLGRERVRQQAARLPIAGDDQALRGLEVASRLLVVPRGGAWGEALKAEGSPGGMADVAARVAGVFGEEQRLDAGLEELEIQGRRRLGLRLGWGNERSCHSHECNDCTNSGDPHGALRSLQYSTRETLRRKAEALQVTSGWVVPADGGADLLVRRCPPAGHLALDDRSSAASGDKPMTQRAPGRLHNRGAAPKALPDQPR